MIRWACILLLLATSVSAAPAQGPRLTARWDSATSATIAWAAPGRACLSVAHASGQGVFLGCWEGPAAVTLGHVGPLDGAYRPMAGDVYILVSNGVTTNAPLRGRDVYLAVWRG